MKSKIKTSISLAPDVKERLQKLASTDDRSVSYLLELVADSFARAAEEAADYGVSIKEVAKQIEKIGDDIARKGKKGGHKPQEYQPR